MYKGKYEQNQAPAAPKATKIPAPQEQAAVPAAPQAEVPHRPARTDAPHRPSQTDTPRRPSQTDTPRRSPQAADTRRAPQRKRKKRTTKGTYIFYGTYLALICVFFVVIAIAMGALKDWLVKFEAAQPKVKSQQVFEQLFSDPDWAEIYVLANPDDSSSGSKTAYAAYMETLVGDEKLTFIETSAGLSGDQKYYVCLGDQAIAAFTLTADNKDAEVPDWRLGTVEVYFSRYLSCSIVTLPGYTVTVNGKVLDDSYIVRTVSTKAEEYLPENVHGYRLQELQVTGLKAKPEVVVTDAQGQPVELTYNEETCTYTQVLPEAPTISDDEYDVVLAAAKAYSEYMIAGSYGLTKYFDTNSEIYKTITGGMVIRQSYSSYKFETETISDYYRYSDNLFSAKINLVAKVTRKDGSVKEFEVDSTLIFDKSSGKWIVHDMVNLDIQEEVTMVRLTYKDADNNVLSSEFVDAHTTRLTPPAVTAPEGQEFIGWFMETVDESGNTTLTLKFPPAENGSVNLSGEQALEPMVLVPRFENAEGNA